MGTRLPDTFRKPNGEPYLSGTEWEYEDAISADPPPHVLVYRRRTKVVVDLDDSDFEEKRAQYALVKQFFERFRNPDGSLRGGFTEYDTPQEFRDRLRTDLRAIVQRRLEAEVPRGGHEARVTRTAAVRRDRPGTARRARHPGHRARRVAVGTPGRRGMGRHPAPQFLPSGLDLSRLLADDSDFPSPTIATASRRSRRTTRRSARAPRCARGCARFSTRRTLAVESRRSIASWRRFPCRSCIVTTNLRCTARARLRRRRPALRSGGLSRGPPGSRQRRPVVAARGHRADHAGHQRARHRSRRPPPSIFKMHGAFLPDTDAWDGCVITEEDYVEFLSRVSSKAAIPALFSAHFHDRSLLFIGFSLRDWNVRTMLRTLSRYFARWAGATTRTRSRRGRSPTSSPSSSASSG